VQVHLQPRHHPSPHHRHYRVDPAASPLLSSRMLPLLEKVARR
jgi:hypothetical protein